MTGWAGDPGSVLELPGLILLGRSCVSGSERSDGIGMQSEYVANGSRMDFSSIDIDAMAEVIELVSDDIATAYRTNGPYSADLVGPEMLRDALRQFIDVLRRIEADATTASGEPAYGKLGPDEVAELGDYALSVLQDLGEWATQLRRDEAHERLDTLAVQVGLWVARHGGRINELGPVVNGFAMLANTTREPMELTKLSRMMDEITAAAAPAVQRDLDRSEPGRPWRILNLNHGIVATRTHDPALMRAVFDELVRHLPEDAPAFFAEGMEQMDALNYPAAVREVMENYHRRFAVKTLH